MDKYKYLVRTEMQSGDGKAWVHLADQYAANEQEAFQNAKYWSKMNLFKRFCVRRVEIVERDMAMFVAGVELDRPDAV